MSQVPNPDDMPSRRYVVRVYDPETDETHQEKVFDPSLSDSRRGAIGTHVWAWSNGFETETVLAE